MRAMPVVMVGPVIEHGGSLVGVVIDETVGPFAQRRLDKALGFAIGLRAIRFGKAVGDIQGSADAGKGFGAKGSTVISEQTPDGDAKRCVISHRRLQKGN